MPRPALEHRVHVSDRRMDERPGHRLRRSRPVARPRSSDRPPSERGARRHLVHHAAARDADDRAEAGPTARGHAGALRL